MFGKVNMRARVTVIVKLIKNVYRDVYMQGQTKYVLEVYRKTEFNYVELHISNAYLFCVQHF